jgi:hypothetical protein
MKLFVKISIILFCLISFQLYTSDSKNVLNNVIFHCSDGSLCKEGKILATRQMLRRLEEQQYYFFEYERCKEETPKMAGTIIGFAALAAGFGFFSRSHAELWLPLTGVFAGLTWISCTTLIPYQREHLAASKMQKKIILAQLAKHPEMTDELLEVLQAWPRLLPEGSCFNKEFLAQISQHRAARKIKIVL